jgi:hypothetical protein
MERHMKEHSACKREYFMNRTFGDAVVMVSTDDVLMVSTDATEFQFLAFLVTVGSECLHCKDAIVHVISLDRNATIEYKTIILLFANESLAGTGRDLIVDENMPGGMIDKDRPTSQFVALLFLSKRVRQAARDRRDILIERDSVTRLDIVTNQRMYFIGVRDCSISIGSLGRGLGQETGRAWWMLAGSSSGMLGSDDGRLTVSFTHKRL